MENMKKLGFGLMRMPLTDPNNQAAVDEEQLKQMIDLFISGGFTYFDTALMYNGGASEAVAKTCLVDRYPRESFRLATKLHAAFFRDRDDLDRVFEGQLQKTGAGYFDYYLLHGVEGMVLPKFEECGCFEWLLEKKRQGLVRHAGFSFHDSAELLDDILTRHPEMEFVQLQINYLDWESEWIQSRKNYETAVKHGKKVIVMEPVKGGTLANVPEEVKTLLTAARPDMSVPSWAIRFAASLPEVMVVLSGMSNLAQMQDNVRYMTDFRPLTEEETALTRRAAAIINGQTAIPCTGCSYCTGGCPMQIAIPQYFSLYNDVKRENMEEKGWTATFGTYTQLASHFGKAGDCIACGQCEEVCPQHLPVIDNLSLVAELFEH